MKTLVSFFVFALAAAPGAFAMGKGTCNPVGGEFVVTSCQGGGDLWLPAPKNNWTGEPYDFMAKAPEGTVVQIAQGLCDSVTLSYGKLTTELRRGGTHLSGPTSPASGVNSIDEKVGIGRDGTIDVTLKSVYVYVPVISVWTSKAHWRLARGEGAGLVVTYSVSGVAFGRCHELRCVLRPVSKP